MKVKKKRELQQIAFKHSSDIGFQDFINIHKMCTAKPYFFLVIDTTIKSDSSLRLRKNLLEKIGKLIMTTDGKIRDEQLHYDINREPAKISSLSS